MALAGTARTYYTWHQEAVTPQNKRILKRWSVDFKQTHLKPKTSLVFRSSSWAVASESENFANKTTEIELPARFQFSGSDWISHSRQKAMDKPIPKSTVHKDDVLNAFNQIFLRELKATRSPTSIEPISVHELCQKYVDIVSKVDIVKQVIVAEAELYTTVCAIINAPPFEDSLRKPIYDAELEILRSLTTDMLVDFRIHNIQELSEGIKLKDIIPPNAKLIWQR